MQKINSSIVAKKESSENAIRTWFVLLPFDIDCKLVAIKWLEMSDMASWSCNLSLLARVSLLFNLAAFWYRWLPLRQGMQHENCKAFDGSMKGPKERAASASSRAAKFQNLLITITKLLNYLATLFIMLVAKLKWGRRLQFLLLVRSKNLACSKKFLGARIITEPASRPHCNYRKKPARADYWHVRQLRN